MKDILFIFPKVVYRAHQYYEIPLGMLYVATVLKEQGYVVHTLDMNDFYDKNEGEIISSFLSINTIDVVCTGGLSAFFNSIERILLAVRKIDFHLPIVIGGGIVSSDAAFICELLKPDYAVIGEGEETIVELFEGLKGVKKLSDITGIGYIEDNKWIFTPAREAIDDISNLPYPDYSLIDIEGYFKRQTPVSTNYLYPIDYPRALPILTSRSCPLNCTFCFHPTGQKYRKKSLNLVFEEIEFLIEKYNINVLVVMDEMMSASKQRLIDFANGIKKYNLFWTCQLLVNSVDDETLKIMRESGCFLVGYGLESINNTVLKSMRKHGVNKDKIEKCLELTVKNKITIQGNFIFGDPAETVETSDETLQWWSKFPEYHISLGRISPYPGTQLYTYALEHGYIKDREAFIRQGTPSLNLTQMSSEEYSSLISKMSIASSKARQFGKVDNISIDNSSDEDRYKCDIICPHCNSTITYKNIYIEKPVIFKLGCRNCALRFDVNPAKFPGFQKTINEDRKKLLEFKSKYDSFIVSPCIFEGLFIEYFDMLELDYDDFNIKYFMDSSNARENQYYLDKYKIVKREKKYFTEELKNTAVIIMSTHYKIDIANEFINLGISEDKIHAIEVI